MFQEQFFREAIKLGEQGRGRCGINPFIGAVLVKDGRVIGRGYSQDCGKNHAEIEAILNAQESTEGADLYVTMEPCCHYGKTPPCTEAIIKAGIKRVYAGIKDPNPLVNGKGFEMLIAAGIEVKSGFEENRVNKQLEYYLTYRREQRPFMIMKNAVSLDGKIATGKGESQWISCPEARTYTHILRQEAGAVLTGIDTVLSDDPLLNVRLEDKMEPVLRIILDSRLRIPLDSKIVRTASEFPTIVFKRDDYSDPIKEKSLQQNNIQIKSIPPETEEFLSLTHLIDELNKLELPVILIEAGPRVCSSFIKAGLVDKLYYFIAPMLIGGNKAVFDDLGVDKLAQSIDIRIDGLERMGDDLLIIGYIINKLRF